AVPRFDGHNISVSKFARACKRVLNSLPAHYTAETETSLIRLLISKLNGHAYVIVENLKITKVEQLIDHLKDAFLPAYGSNYYRGQLATEFKKPKEHVLDYFSRIRDLTQSIIDEESKQIGRLERSMERKIEEEGLNAFVCGLPSDYRTALRFERYTDFSSALICLLRIEKQIRKDAKRTASPNLRSRVANSATIDYTNGCLKLCKKVIPFVADESICVPSRMSQICYCYVANTEVREGYIPQLQLPPGVYAGEALNKNENGKAYFKVINTTSKSVSLAIPRLELFAYNTVQLQRQTGVGGDTHTIAVFGGGRTGHPPSTSGDYQESGVGNPAPALVNAPGSCSQVGNLACGSTSASGRMDHLEEWQRAARAVEALRLSSSRSPFSARSGKRRRPTATSSEDEEDCVIVETDPSGMEFSSPGNEAGRSREEECGKLKRELKKKEATIATFQREAAAQNQKRASGPSDRSTPANDVRLEAARSSSMEIGSIMAVLREIAKGMEALQQSNKELWNAVRASANPGQRPEEKTAQKTPARESAEASLPNIARVPDQHVPTSAPPAPGAGFVEVGWSEEKTPAATGSGSATDPWQPGWSQGKAACYHEGD
ncbi:hypothetical protein M0804_015122, partial [Polistes exclamans]